MPLFTVIIGYGLQPERTTSQGLDSGREKCWENVPHSSLESPSMLSTKQNLSLSHSLALSLSLCSLSPKEKNVGKILYYQKKKAKKQLTVEALLFVFPHT